MVLRAGVKIRPPSQCLATCIVPPLPLSLPPSSPLYLILSSLPLSLYLFFILFFTCSLYRISVSSATFLILFFPPPFHPFSSFSFFFLPPFVLRFRPISFQPSASLSLSFSLFMGSIRTRSLTVQDGMKLFGMSWSGAGSNSWTNEPTDRTAGACSQIDARGSSWAPLFVYLLHPLYSLLTLLILVHSPLQARKG